METNSARVVDAGHQRQFACPGPALCDSRRSSGGAVAALQTSRTPGVPTSRFQLIPLMIVTDPVDAACRWPTIAWYSSDS